MLRSTKHDVILAAGPIVNSVAFIILICLLYNVKVVQNSVGQIGQRIEGLRGKIEEARQVSGGLKADYLSKEQKLALDKIEIHISDDVQAWPKSSAEAMELLDDHVKLMKSMDSATQLANLPRLLKTRWAVKTFCTIIQAESVALEQAPELQDGLDSLLADEPDDIPKKLHEQVDRTHRELEERLNRFQRDEAIRLAKDAIAGNGNPSAAYEGLANIKDDEAKSLRDQLKRLAQEKVYSEKIALLRQTLATSKGLDNDRLRQAGIARVQDAAINVLLDLQNETSVPKSENAIVDTRTLIEVCQKSLEEIGKRQLEDFARKQRDYQRWALEEIQRFDSVKGWHYDAALDRIDRALKSFGNPQKEFTWDLLVEFPSTKEVLSRTVGVDLAEVEGGRLTIAAQKKIYTAAAATIGWKKDVNIELAYLATREAMIKWLSPINISLLDPPVAQLYQKAHMKGWEKLEGRDDQLEVAKAAARVVKKSLE